MSVLVDLSDDQADLVIRALKWAGSSCDSISRTWANDGTIVFAGRHTRDRCQSLATIIEKAAHVYGDVKSG